MRYIIRQVGKYDPIFDQEIKDGRCLFIDDLHIKFSYISHNTDDGNAVVLNLRSTKDVYVEVEKIDDMIWYTLRKVE